MRDVIGYEEKDPAVTQHMTSGYPRFVQHPYLRQAAQHLLAQEGSHDEQLWLTASAHAATGLANWLAPTACRVVNRGGLHGVAFPAHPDTYSRAKTWLQHVGAFASSRAAEDYLHRQGLLPTTTVETLRSDSAHEALDRYFSNAFAPATARDWRVTCTGMNAIWAAFQAVREVQLPRGRTKWLQLGWLYLDTIAILQKFTGDASNYLCLHDVFDVAALDQIFSAHGSELAGVITEVPTNPLIQTLDLPRLHALCRRHGVHLIVDPTIASPLNLDVLPHADVVVNSLTKYTASEGDVILGVVVVHPGAPDAAVLRAGVERHAEPPYPRDLYRLAAQIGDTEAVIARTNETAGRVARFLQSHPRVDRVWWGHELRSLPHLRALARRGDAVGSVISFTVKGELARFYDRLALAKGPSFGMKTTLICPFMYLAHYDLVSQPAGREYLLSKGIPADLLRLSVGCEPAEDIIAELTRALEP